jgi:hypothetical protein
MPEAIWLLSIGLYRIQRSYAMPIIRAFLASDSDTRIGSLLMSECGPYCAVTYLVSPTAWTQVIPNKYAYIEADSEPVRHQALREDKVRDEIARRLSRVCSNFSEREFQELVSKMAERQLLDERRQRW